LETGEILEEPKVHKYDNELKLRSLRKFVNQYALETPKQEDNIIKSAKKNHKAYQSSNAFLEVSLDDISTEIYEKDEASLVYFMDADNESDDQIQNTFLLDTLGNQYLGAI